MVTAVVGLSYDAISTPLFPLSLSFSLSSHLFLKSPPNPGMRNKAQNMQTHAILNRSTSFGEGTNAWECSRWTIRKLDHPWKLFNPPCSAHEHVCERGQRDPYLELAHLSNSSVGSLPKSDGKRQPDQRWLLIPRTAIGNFQELLWCHKREETSSSHEWNILTI